jgi:hypothetical protein
MNHIFNLFDRQPLIPLGLTVVVIIMAIMHRRAQRSMQAAGTPAAALPDHQHAAPPKQPSSPLDIPLFHWTPRDPFRVRDLLNGGALILGRAGSGKTSSSGRALMQAIVNFDEEKKP